MFKKHQILPILGHNFQFLPHFWLFFTQFETFLPHFKKYRILEKVGKPTNFRYTDYAGSPVPRYRSFCVPGLSFFFSLATVDIIILQAWVELESAAELERALDLHKKHLGNRLATLYSHCSYSWPAPGISRCLRQALATWVASSNRLEWGTGGVEGGGAGRRLGQGEDHLKEAGEGHLQEGGGDHLKEGGGDHH